MLATGTDLTPRGLLAAAPPIVDAQVSDLVLRKSDPTWRFALAANPTNPGLLLTLRAADGTVGLGSAGEIMHLGHGLAEMRAALTAMVPVLMGVKTSTCALDDLDRIGGPARAIVQMALLDLVARVRRVPAFELLGERRRDGVELIRILSLKSPQKMASVAAAHRAEGYKHVKIKLDNGPDDVDFRRVAAIREACGPNFGMTVDANQSYTVARDALRLCERLAPFGVLVFEQPVPANDLDGLAFLTRRSPIPIEADEAADSLVRVQQIVDRSAAHGVSIKIPKLGGIDRAAEAMAICAHAGVSVRMGAHVGSQLLNAAALELAVVVDNLSEPSELAEFARLDGDPISGLSIRDGQMHVPDSPGLGVVNSSFSEGINSPTTGKDAL